MGDVRPNLRDWAFFVVVVGVGCGVEWGSKSLNRALKLNCNDICERVSI